jgi:hypothetical protein
VAATWNGILLGKAELRNTTETPVKAFPLVDTVLINLATGGPCHNVFLCNLSPIGFGPVRSGALY